MLRIVNGLLLCLIGGAALGQGTWSVSGAVTPAFIRTDYRRTVLFPISDGQVVEPVERNGPINAFSYATGLTVHYTYAPGWSVATGVWYREHIARQPRRTIASAGTTTIRERAVRIPVLLTYRASLRRLSPYYSLGLLVDLPLTSRIIERRSSQPTQNLRLNGEGGPVFNVMLGAGGIYQINPRWAVLAQPVATYKLGRFGDAQNRNPAVELGLLTQVIRSF